jgi:hypothetical protein
MTVHKVQLVRNGKSGGAEVNIEAPTEKEAAEKASGVILFKQGSSENVRAIVQAPRGVGNPTLFYER